MAYMIINFANIDVIITKSNVERYFETGKLDTHYLSNLSYDSIPELVSLLDDKKVSADIKKYLAEEQKVVSEKQSWQSFNLSKYKAIQVLSQYKF